jgi:hypothetical protein
MSQRDEQRQLTRDAIRKGFEHLMVFAHLKRQQKLTWNGARFNLYHDSLPNAVIRYFTRDNRQLHMQKIREQYQCIGAQIDLGIKGSFNEETIHCLKQLHRFLFKSKLGLRYWSEIKEYADDFDIQTAITLLITVDIPNMCDRLTQYIKKRLTEDCVPPSTALEGLGEEINSDEDVALSTETDEELV